jgi:hypothetical protein
MFKSHLIMIRGGGTKLAVILLCLEKNPVGCCGVGETDFIVLQGRNFNAVYHDLSYGPRMANRIFPFRENVGTEDDDSCVSY